MSSPAFNKLFTRHAMAAYAKQLALADAIEGAGAWDSDLEAGTLSFADGPTLRIEVLGSFGTGAESWLWVWANRNMNLPPEITATATKLREIGRNNSISELSEPETHDKETFCHRLSMVAVGEAGAGAYYRAPYEGGAAYLLVRDAMPVSADRHRLGRIQRVIAETISTFEISDQRAALEAYFKTEMLPCEESEPNELIVSAEDGDLRIRFDAEGRITEMKSLLRAATKPSGGFFNRLFRKEDDK